MVKDLGIRKQLSASNFHNYQQYLVKMRLLTKERTRACTAAFKDTGHLSILIDDHEIGEVPGDALRYDPLQGQTSSVVHVGIWDDCGQLLAKPHRPLQDTNQMMWHKSLCVSG